MKWKFMKSQKNLLAFTDHEKQYWYVIEFFVLLNFILLIFVTKISANGVFKYSIRYAVLMYTIS